jgi:uncharacterized protein (DUF58 family)
VRPDVAAACAPWRLALPVNALSGRFGDRMGRGTGSSLEFTEFREYVAGDDLRHLDWRAYARTDAMHVRLFREEVAPHLDVVLDVSGSMAATPGKDRAARDLCDALAHLAERSGSKARRLAAGGPPLDDDVPAPPFSGRDGGSLLPLVPLRPRALRAVVSDFLVQGDPASRLRALAAGAAHLTVVQVLDPWEAAPDLEGAVTLEDVEDGARLDLDLGRTAVERYRRRLERLRDDVARATRSVAGTYALVIAADLGTMLREALGPQGVVEPA